MSTVYGKKQRARELCRCYARRCCPHHRQELPATCTLSRAAGLALRTCHDEELPESARVRVVSVDGVAYCRTERSRIRCACGRGLGVPACLSGCWHTPSVSSTEPKTRWMSQTGHQCHSYVTREDSLEAYKRGTPMSLELVPPPQKKKKIE